MPGAAAGYAKGRADVRLCVAHFTAGRDSTGPGLSGLFPFLVRRNGEVVQFAEVDALCYHACEWNRTGPGVEVEYLPGVDDAVFTDASRAACGALVRWLSAEWGIPLAYYDGPRLPIGDPFTGFVAHGSLVHQACDQHTDSWPRADWDAMIAAPPTSEDEMDRYTIDGSSFYALVPHRGWRPCDPGPAVTITIEDYAAMGKAELVPALTAEDVTAIVDAELVGRKLVVPPLDPKASVSARNMAKVLRDTTIGAKPN